jgi:hypothetical protein
MSDVFEKNIKNILLKSRLKHLRGQHDQRDHAWNRGMGAGGAGGSGKRGGGAGVGLGPNQMGPVPTMQMYRQQQASLMDQYRQGDITRQEMRQESALLRGITSSPNQVQGANFVLANQNRRQGGPLDRRNRNTVVPSVVRAGTEKRRNAQRLPFHITPKSLGGPRKSTGKTAGNIQVIETKDKNGNIKKYFYRANPTIVGKRTPRGDFGFNREKWLNGPTFLMPLVADDIATAMGLDIVPVAQISKNGTIITNDMELPQAQNVQAYLSDIMNEMRRNPSTDLYMQIERAIEPAAMMDLILGQTDGHAGNYALITGDKTGTKLPYSLGAIDFDLAGAHTANRGSSMALDTLYDLRTNYYQYRPAGETGYASENMKNLLLDTLDHIQFNDAIPDKVRDQILQRIEAISDFSKNLNVQAERSGFFQTGPITRTYMQFPQEQLRTITDKARNIIEINNAELANSYATGDEYAQLALNEYERVSRDQTYQRTLGESAKNAITSALTPYASTQDLQNEILDLINAPVDSGIRIAHLERMQSDAERDLVKKAEDIKSKNRSKITEIKKEVEQVNGAIRLLHDLKSLLKSVPSKFSNLEVISPNELEKLYLTLTQANENHNKAQSELQQLQQLQGRLPADKYNQYAARAQEKINIARRLELEMAQQYLFRVVNNALFDKNKVKKLLTALGAITPPKPSRESGIIVDMDANRYNRDMRDDPTTEGAFFPNPLEPSFRLFNKLNPNDLYSIQVYVNMLLGELEK